MIQWKLNQEQSSRLCMMNPLPFTTTLVKRKTTVPLSPHKLIPVSYHMHFQLVKTMKVYLTKLTGKWSYKFDLHLCLLEFWQNPNSCKFMYVSQCTVRVIINLLYGNDKLMYWMSLPVLLLLVLKRKTAAKDYHLLFRKSGT